MKKFLMRFASALSAIALFMSISSVNTPSMYFFHQPKVPTGLEKYRK